MKRIFFFFLPLTLCQCASLDKSIGLGAGIGAVSGGAASQLARYNTKGTAVLTLSGAVLGGIIAALLHKDVPPTSPSIPMTSIIKNNPPPLKNAEHDVILVPDKIEGDRFEEAHRVFMIKNPAHWQLRGSDQTSVDQEEKE